MFLWSYLDINGRTDNNQREHAGFFRYKGCQEYCWEQILTLGIFLARSWILTGMGGSVLQWGPKGTTHTQMRSQDISTISLWMSWNHVSAELGRKTTATLIEYQLFQGNSSSIFCLCVTWSCYINCHTFINFNKTKLFHFFMFFIFMFEGTVMWCKISLWKKDHNGTQNTKIYLY